MRLRTGRRLFHAVSVMVCVLTAATAVHAAGEYRTVDVEGLKITIDLEWASRNAPGYLPVRFDITNFGEARVIEIVGRGSRFFRGRSPRPAGTTVTQTVRLARGDRVRLTVPVPIYADNENIRFEIFEDGRALEQFNYNGFQSRARPDDAAALIVADSSTAFGKAAASWPRNIAASSGAGATVMVSPGGSSSAPRALDFLLHPARLPSNWLGFTSLRAVVIGPEEWNQLDQGQKTALLTWTACGGDLIVVDGDVAALFSAGQRPPGAILDGAAGAYFFGRVHVMSSAAVAQGGLSGVLSKTGPLQDATWALPANRAGDWGAIEARGFRLPIPGIGGVPARAYLSILFVFSLLIGPANYWFLRRKRQQVLLVLTTPIISMIFILLLAGYVVAGEGLGVRGRAASFTMLDQARRQAATRASASLYAAGLSPAGGLRFARDSAIYALGPEGDGSRAPQALDLTQAQHFADGVIEARAPTNLETIAFRQARERLNFSREAGGLRVVNGLGAKVLELFYRESGTVYRAIESIAEGGQGTLKPSTDRPSDVVPPRLPLSRRFAHVFDNLPEGSYVAVLERSPFWDPGVKRVEERSSFHVVFGWVGGQP